MYVVSNQEDLLLCGAGMRLCSRMLAGPQMGGIRQVVPGLSTEDCRLISAGSIRHFPILVRTDSDLVAGAVESSIEFSRIRELIFRSEEERNRVAHVRMRDVLLDGMPTSVLPELFELPESFLEYEACDVGALSSMRSSNRAAGALCGALAVVQSREDVGDAIALLFGDRQESPINVFLADGYYPGSSATELALLAACCDTLSHAREENEIDPTRIADLMVRESAKLAIPVQQRVMKWRDWLSPRLNYQVSLEPSDFTDPHENQSAVLRAFTLLLFRKGLASLVGEKSKGRSVGPMVSIIAAALAGFREGLDGIDVTVKQRTTGVVDSLACMLDATPEDARSSLARFFDVGVEPADSRVLVRFLPSSHIVFDSQADNGALLERIIALIEAGGLAVKRDGEFISIDDLGGHVRLRIEEQAVPPAISAHGTIGTPSVSAKQKTSKKSPTNRAKKRTRSNDRQPKDVKVMMPDDDQASQEEVGGKVSRADEACLSAGESNQVQEEESAYDIGSENVPDHAIKDGDMSAAVSKPDIHSDANSERIVRLNEDGEKTGGDEGSTDMVAARGNGDSKLRTSTLDDSAKSPPADSQSLAGPGDLFGGETNVKSSRALRKTSSGRATKKPKSRSKGGDV